MGTRKSLLVLSVAASLLACAAGGRTGFRGHPHVTIPTTHQAEAHVSTVTDTRHGRAIVDKNNVILERRKVTLPLKKVNQDLNQLSKERMMMAMDRVMSNMAKVTADLDTITEIMPKVIADQNNANLGRGEVTPPVAKVIADPPDLKHPRIMMSMERAMDKVANQRTHNVGR